MMKLNRGKGYFWGVCIVGLIMSCTNEHILDSDSLFINGEVDVTVNVGFTPQTTDFLRAGETDPLSEIKNVDALIFDMDDKFIERIKVDDLNLHENHRVSFKIKMKATADKRTIHFVINGRFPDDDTDRLNFNDLTLGMSMVDAMERLATNSPIFEESETLLDKILPVVMWGVLKMENGVSAAGNAANINLLPSVAIIEINWPSFGNGVLIGGYMPKALMSGYLVPNNWKDGVAIPSTPRQQNGETLPLGLYRRSPLLGDINHFYAFTYEQNCDNNNYQYIILHVDHNSNSPIGYGKGFYKIALTDENGNPLNILRNHHYILTVESVNGPGYSDINTAMNSAPSNDLKIQIIDKNDQYPIVITSGDWSMALSNNDVCIYGNFYELDNETDKPIDKGIPLIDVELCRVITTKSDINLKWAPQLGSLKITNLRAKPISSSSSRYEYSIRADIIPQLQPQGYSDPNLCKVEVNSGNIRYNLNVFWKKKSYGVTNEEDINTGISLNVDMFWKDQTNFDEIQFKRDNWLMKIVNVEYDSESIYNMWITLSDQEIPSFGYGTREFKFELSSKVYRNAYVCLNKSYKVGSEENQIREKATVLISGHLEHTNEPYNRRIIFCRPSVHGIPD